MLHRQLRTALEEIFGDAYVSKALNQPEMAQLILYERPQDFKETVLGFQRLNYREDQRSFAVGLEATLGVALICSLLDESTRELVTELGLNYI